MKRLRYLRTQNCGFVYKTNQRKHGENSRKKLNVLYFKNFVRTKNLKSIETNFIDTPPAEGQVYLAVLVNLS